MYQKIEELKETAGRHRNEFNKCEKELAQVQSSFDCLKANDEEKEHKISILTESNNYVEKENGELKEQLKKLNANLNDAAEKNLQNEIIVTSTDVQIVESAPEMWDEKDPAEDSTILKRKIDELKSDLAESQDREKDSQAKFMELNAYIVKLESIYEQLVARKEEIEQQLYDAQREYKPLNDEFASTKAELLALGKQYSDIKRENASLRMQLNKSDRVILNTANAC